MREREKEEEEGEREGETDRQNRDRKLARKDHMPNIGVVPQAPSAPVFEIGSHWPGIHQELVWLATKPEGPTCLCLFSIEIIRIYHNIWIFTWVLGADSNL